MSNRVDSADPVACRGLCFMIMRVDIYGRRTSNTADPGKDP